MVGISYLDLGDFQKSLEYFKSGLKMFYELNPAPYEKIAALQSNIAYNYNKLGNHEEALTYAQASVDIFKKNILMNIQEQFILWMMWATH